MLPTILLNNLVSGGAEAMKSEIDEVNAIKALGYGFARWKSHLQELYIIKRL